MVIPVKTAVVSVKVVSVLPWLYNVSISGGKVCTNVRNISFYILDHKFAILIYKTHCIFDCNQIIHQFLFPLYI